MDNGALLTRDQTQTLDAEPDCRLALPAGARSAREYIADAAINIGSIKANPRPKANRPCDH